MNTLQIELLTKVDDRLEELSDLLKLVVDEGASIGFLPPMDATIAKEYWKAVLQPNVLLLVATIDNVIVGSIQLHKCTKESGLHRAEVVKLMTHPNYRRLGVGRKLLQHVENIAMEEQITLLYLDTRDGDPSNDLYTSMGYIPVGKIPFYAKSANGKLDATIFYFKWLGQGE